MENQNIEYKSNWRDEHLKTISAFANTNGGKLFIGMDNNGIPIGIEGNLPKLLEDIPNKIKNRLGIIPSVEHIIEKNKNIICITIKPSNIPVSYDGKYYIRSGSNNFELSGNELANFLNSKAGTSWDKNIEYNADFDEIKLETIEKFKKLAVDRLPYIINEKDYKTILEKLNLLVKNNITRAAILLFGKNPQKFYISACIKIGKFLTETEILTTDKIEGNLFEQLETTLEVLKNKYLKSEIKYEDIHRREILEYPYEALREAIINALIHRDYLPTSNIQIKVYEDKLIIINEGKLPEEIPVEKLKTEHISKPRNPILADVFYKAGYIESWGRGTLKIVESFLKQGLPEPDFVQENGIMKVKFYKNKWGLENLERMGLNERQIKGVKYVIEHGNINLSSYQNLVQEVSEKTGYRDLTDLVNKGILKVIGKNKGQKYKLN